MHDPTLPPELVRAIESISSPDPETAARAHLDTLTKPLGALGRLEDLAAQMQSLRLQELRKAVYVFAADHGVAAAGVSAYPAEVTRQMVLNFLAGGAAINVLARAHGVVVEVVDAGVAGEPLAHPALRGPRVRAGSRNMLHEPAMSAEEMSAALKLGLRCADESQPYNLVAVGEMGIGNTSSASLLTAALTGHPLAEVTGRGTGLDSAAHLRKLATLEQVQARHGAECTTPAETLRRVGGLEIAAMTGFITGLAARGAGVVLDGFISTAAGAFAVELAPAVRPWLFSGHRSQEPGHRALLEHLRLRPILDLEMRLGEGTGAVLAMPVLESALAIYREMATFRSAGVSGAEA